MITTTVEIAALHQSGASTVALVTRLSKTEVDDICSAIRRDMRAHPDTYEAYVDKRLLELLNPKHPHSKERK